MLSYTRILLVIFEIQLDVRRNLHTGYADFSLNKIVNSKEIGYKKKL